MKSTRITLLKTSARIFARKGYTGTSVRDIVHAAHVNVSAIAYYFGGKRELFFETLRFLIEKRHQQLWPKSGLPVLAEINTYSYSQALHLLHQIFDKLLDSNLTRKQIYLERMFTQMELESADMRRMLLEYMTPFHKLPCKLIAKLTGLPEKSPQLLCVMHSIFGQIMLSESHRMALEHSLGGIQNYTSAQREIIKKTMWKHALGILNLYKKDVK